MNQRDVTTLPDPPVRADGRCAVCHGPRGLLPKSIPQHTRELLRAALAADPFCSNPCARKWHRTTLTGQPEKAPAADLDWTHA